MTEHSNVGSSTRPWSPGPGHPHLAPGAVDVWRVDLAVVPDDLLELLSPGEHARAERMARARDRELWARSRGVLRGLLGRYLQTDGRTLRLVTDGRGKPTLDPDRARTEREAASTQLCFNLSHSGTTALYAFSTAGPVGIDVEVARRPIDTVALATRALGPAEAARLRELDPRRREQEFLRAWVRHEATLKCLGLGIGGSAQGRAEPAPWIAELDIGERAAAALALSAGPTYVRCWDWFGPAPRRKDPAPAG
jgi:4'-phosphopantetheinyl transferase